MFPNQGTWTFYLLTNRLLHAGITLGVLVSLVFAIYFQDFVHTTPYADLLPRGGEFWRHPVEFLGRYWQVYQMHVDWVSVQTAEMRRQRVEDVRKRSEYRKAHEMVEEGVFGGWTAKSDAEVMGPGMREGGDVSVVPVVSMGDSRGISSSENGDKRDTYVDFDGNRQQVERKRWFGIW